MLVKFVKDEEELRDLIREVDFVRYKLMKVERIGAEKLKVQFEKLDKSQKQDRILKSLRAKKEILKDHYNKLTSSKVHIHAINKEMKELRRALKR